MGSRMTRTREVAPHGSDSMIHGRNRGLLLSGHQALTDGMLGFDVAGGWDACKFSEWDFRSCRLKIHRSEQSARFVTAARTDRQIY